MPSIQLSNLNILGQTITANANLPTQVLSRGMVMIVNDNYDAKFYNRHFMKASGWREAVLCQTLFYQLTN